MAWIDGWINMGCKQWNTPPILKRFSGELYTWQDFACTLIKWYAKHRYLEYANPLLWLSACLQHLFAHPPTSIRPFNLSVRVGVADSFVRPLNVCRDAIRPTHRLLKVSNVRLRVARKIENVIPTRTSWRTDECGLLGLSLWPLIRV